MIAATTQIRRRDFDENHPLNKEIRELNPFIYEELSKKIEELKKKRLTKGGKKSYDYMVAGYFNDMFKVLKEVYLKIKKGGVFILVLGDSAPYGIHIPTEGYLGELGISIGYSDYNIELLRRRGDKWANNPQRHNVKLKESILYIKK